MKNSLTEKKEIKQSKNIWPDVCKNCHKQLEFNEDYTKRVCRAPDCGISVRFSALIHDFIWNE